MSVIIKQGDCLDVMQTMRSGTVSMICTSPPYYGLRDYGHDDQLGLEETPQQYIDRLVEMMREGRRVLADNGTLWLNIGDSYAGSNKGTGGKNGIQNNNKGSFHSKGAQLKMKVHVGGKKQQGNKGSGGFEKPVPNTGLAEKNLLGIPWRLALALQADGWILRSDIIWSKPNPMPESVLDRCTKSHEHIFMLAKQTEYYFDGAAISEPARDWHQGSTTPRYGDGLVISGGNTGLTKKKTGELRRNKRDVWSCPGASYDGAHFATYPPALIVDCIKAGCPPKGTVLDPFFGSGTTGMVARKLGRKCIGIELNPDYIKIAKDRLWKNEGFNLEFLEG